MAEAVRLFLLPPLLTLALVASTLVVFASYLSERDQRTTYVSDREHRDGAGDDLAAWGLARPALAAPRR